MTDNLLQQAIALAQAGRKEEALPLLDQVLTANPKNEIAWLWFADCQPSMDERIQALELVVEAMPEAKRAQAGLAALRRARDKEVAAAAAAAPEPAEQEVPAAIEQPAAVEQPAAQEVPAIEELPAAVEQPAAEDIEEVLAAWSTQTVEELPAADVEEPAGAKAEETLFFEPAALAEEAPADDLKDVLDAWFNPSAVTEPEETVAFKSAPQIEEAPAEDLKDVLAAWFSESAEQVVPAEQEVPAAEELPAEEEPPAEIAEETFFVETPSEVMEGTPEGLDAILAGLATGGLPEMELPAAEEQPAAEEPPAEIAEGTFTFETPSEEMEGTPEGLDAILAGLATGGLPEMELPAAEEPPAEIAEGTFTFETPVKAEEAQATDLEALLASLAAEEPAQMTGLAASEVDLSAEMGEFVQDTAPATDLEDVLAAWDAGGAAAVIPGMTDETTAAPVEDPAAPAGDNAASFLLDAPWLSEEEVITPAGEESAPTSSFFYTGTLAEPAPTEQAGTGEPPVESAAEAWPVLNPMSWEEASADAAAGAPAVPETSEFGEIDLAALFEETREPESSLPAAAEGQPMADELPAAEETMPAEFPWLNEAEFSAPEEKAEVEKNTPAAAAVAAGAALAAAGAGDASVVRPPRTRQRSEKETGKTQPRKTIKAPPKKTNSTLVIILLVLAALGLLALAVVLAWIAINAGTF